VCIITKPTVTNSHRPVHTYRSLPKFAIKLQKQKLFKRVIIKVISAFVQYDGTSTEQSLNGGALDGIVELKRKKTDLTAGCLLSMLRSRLESRCKYFKCGWSWSDCPPFRSLKKSVSESPVDRSYSIECDHHIDHNDTYYTISERNDELFIFF